jgi:Ser/Thr protein kinase RdoA (MazF antagonist)
MLAPTRNLTMLLNLPAAEHYSLDVVSSTLSGDAISRVVEALYPVGAIKSCHLARRGFNHVYEILLQDGRRCIARLSSHRPRGVPNIDYEAAVLSHLKAAGAHVAAPILTRGGLAGAQLTVAEGPRALTVFEFLHGDPPGDNLADIEAMGAGLAKIHLLSQSYLGPVSRYRLDLSHLLLQPLHCLLLAPTMTDTLRESFSAVADRLVKRFDECPALSQVTCHGDCHGGNTFVTDGPDGTRVASFFDFDDAGPGYLAYDLAVYLWGMQMDTAGALNAQKLACWANFLKGFRQVQQIPGADFDAISLFVPIRHFWLMGERASRLHEWGAQALPQWWLTKQVELLTAWELLETPADLA